MKILNLYAGIGGNRKLWPQGHDITAVELNPKIAKIYQDFFPNDNVIVGNAHDYLLEHYKEFDFIWSSPPCPTHSKIRRCGVKSGQCEAKYADMKLYQEIILLQELGPWKMKYCIENVRPYYKPLMPAQECSRHLFWSNFYISNIKLKKMPEFIRSKGKDIMEWLDIYIDKRIYIDGNHDYLQVLRNCVDPKLGLHIYNCAFRDKQLSMF